MSPDAAESVTATSDVACCHGLLSQVSDDDSLHHCCSFTYSPTVIQRKLITHICCHHCSLACLEGVIVVVWFSADCIGHINEVILSQALVVHWWVTIFRYAILTVEQNNWVDKGGWPGLPIVYNYLFFNLHVFTSRLF